jgi:Domain of unknown function (DUF4283)
MAQRYGGLPTDYKVATYSRGDLLVTMPPQMDMATIRSDEMHWTLSYGVNITPWYARQRQFRVPRKFRVHILIRNYPASLWHIKFFRQVVASFGQLEDVARQNIRGEDKVDLALTILNTTPDAVPHGTWILDGYKWIGCLIEITGWEVVPENDPPNDDDDGNTLQGYRPDPLGTPSDDYDSDFLDPISPPHPTTFELEFPEFCGRQRLQQEVATMDPKHLGKKNEAKSRVRDKEGSLPRWAPTVKASQDKSLRGDRAAVTQEKMHKMTGATLSFDMIRGDIKTINERPLLTVGQVTILSQYQLTRVLFPKDGTFKETKNIYLGNTTKETWVTVQLGQYNINVPGQTLESVPGQTSPLNQVINEGTLQPFIRGQNKTSLQQPSKTQNPIHARHIPIQNHSTVGSRSMDLSNDELIQRFSNLAAVDSPQQAGPIHLPSHAFTARNWNLCAVARVISDRVAIDTQFVEIMTRVWRMGPAGSITPIERNTYLIQFASTEEMQTTLDKGSWSYKTDIVALRPAHAPGDLTADYVQSLEIWVQLHQLPPEALTTEGIGIMMGSLGTLLSEVSEFFYNGKKVYKAKVLFPLGQPLTDRITTIHPEMGVLTAYVVYEKVHRACLYCGTVGHEMSSCPTRLRLAKLKMDEAYKNRPEMTTILEPKFGKWIMSATRVPSGASHGENGNHKQPHTENFAGQTNQKDPQHGDHSRSYPTMRQHRTSTKLPLDLNSVLGAPPGTENNTHKRHNPNTQQFQQTSRQYLAPTHVLSTQDVEETSETAQKRMKAGSGAPPPVIQ